MADLREQELVRTRRIIIFSAIVLVGILVLLALPSLTGGEYFKDFFLQQLEESIGRKIDVHRAKLVLFPVFVWNSRRSRFTIGIPKTSCCPPKSWMSSCGCFRSCANRWWRSGC